MPPPFSRRDSFRVLLVAFATLIVGVCMHDLLSASNWQTALHYGGDTLEVLARLKLASESGLDAWLGRPIERLGAPFATTWAAYPQPDQWIFWLGGKLSLYIGLIPAAHVMLLVAHMLGSASFFLCARLLGHRPLWAGGCGLLFGLSHFNIFRGLPHFSFTLSFFIPVMLLVSWWIGRSQRLALTRTTILTGLLLALMVGAGNAYYIFFFLQLLAGAVFFQFFTERRRTNLIAGFALGLALAISTLAWNWPTLWTQFHQGSGDPLVRSYAGNELYALKFVELFVPPPYHHFPIFADFGRYYGGATSLRGELHSAYLGIVPAIGFLLIIASSLRRLLAGRAGLTPSHGPWALWFLLTGSVGGVQAFLALAGLNYFRAGNRYSIVLVALSLFFLSHMLSRIHRLNAHRFVATALCVLITGLGLWDQIPPGPSSSVRRAAGQQIQEDIALAGFLETNLPPQARIFQLPAVPFLEQPTVGAMTDYALFRPFLFSQSLRFSYGSLIRTPEADWARWIGGLPSSDMANMLEASGFHAVCINRLAYADHGQTLIAAFAVAGHPVLPDPAANPVHTVIRLQPSATIQQPDLDDIRLQRPWTGKYPDNGISVYATRGWSGLERDTGHIWRWAGREAVVTVVNSDVSTKKAVVSFQFASNKPGHLTVHLQKKPIWSVPTTIQQISAEDIVVELPPGPTELTWVWQGPLVRPATGDNRKLGFKIQDLRITPANPLQ